MSFKGVDRMKLIWRIASFHILFFVFFLVFVYSIIPASAQVTFTDNEAAFLSQYPNLEYQDFLGTFVAPGNVLVCEAPADAASDDDCFTPGQILPGIEFSINPRFPMSAELTLVGSDIIGNNNPTNPLIANQFGTDFDILFTATNINAVGLTAECLLEGTSCTPRDVTVQVYGENGLLGSTVVTVSDSFDTFVGIKTNEPVVEILLAEEDDSPQSFQKGILNIRFGFVQNVVAANVPTLSEWGIVGAVAGLLLVGVFIVMRRRKGSCCGQK